MRFLLAFLLGFFARQTLADLYRWVDPETGSVKFSSYPPPWVGDPELEKRAPKVEHIPERRPGAAPQNAPATGNSLEALEERRKRIMQQLTVLPAQPDFQRAGNLKQQLDAYGAVTAEMDKLDPRGADRRRAEAQPLLEKLVEGLRSQIKPAPPAK